jgi:hypothetical protein
MPQQTMNVLIEVGFSESGTYLVSLPVFPSAMRLDFEILQMMW